MKLLLIIILSLFLTSALLAQDNSTSVDHQGFETLKSKHLDLVILDVRSDNEYNSGHIAGAVNIEYNNIDAIRKYLKKDKPVIVYCRSGRRAGIVTEQLLASGYSNVYHLDGDMNGWLAAKKPTVKSPD